MTLPGIGLTIPVDDRVVALVRLPVAITPLAAVAVALSDAYGPDLVFRTDTGIDGWVVISRPSDAVLGGTEC